MGILAATLRPKQQALYKVTYLPSLGGEFTLPFSINDQGQIAGVSEVSKRNYHLFLWDRKKGIQDLGPVVNNPVCINNAGQIAATVQDPNGNDRAFIWDPNHGRRLLPMLGGKTTIANGINNYDQVVGTVEISSGLFHACIWNSASEIHDLTPSSPKNTYALSINDADQVVISAKGSLLLVDINKGINSTNRSIPVRGLIEINNNGYVAGLVQTKQGKYNVVIWHPDLGQQKLVQLNANASSHTNINNANQVLLTKGREPKFRLFGRTLFFTRVKNYLHDPKHGWLSLNEYISVGPYENLCLPVLNNKGCIVGAVQSRKDSRSRGVLLEPIPEQWEK